MEKLTDDLVQGASELINQVESEGGMTAAIESGMAKLMIEESAAKKQVRGRREREARWRCLVAACPTDTGWLLCRRVWMLALMWL